MAARTAACVARSTEYRQAIAMAALTGALAGRPAGVLGVQTPVAEIASAATECDLLAVGLSVPA
jgi:hypothetical protein